MRYVNVSIALLCGGLVLGSGFVATIGSFRQTSLDANRYSFDGRRYVIEAATPAPAYLPAPTVFSTLAEARQTLPALKQADELESTDLPFVALMHAEGSLRLLVLQQRDGSLALVYEPGVGSVVYLRRTLRIEFAGWVAEVPTGASP